MRAIKLTRAQRSALECRSGGGLDALTIEAWNGGNWLRFPDRDTDELWRELVDASNAEDAQAEEQGDRRAAGAARALANLSAKVIEKGGIQMTDDDRLRILALALDRGLRGTGGECGETAIAINELLFSGRGELVAAVNSALWKKGRLVGHVGVKVGDVVWDAEGTYDDEAAMEEFMAWGMVDPADPDYELSSEEEAYAVEVVTLTEAQLREMLPFCGAVSPHAVIQEAIGA